MSPWNLVVYIIRKFQYCQSVQPTRSCIVDVLIEHHTEEVLLAALDSEHDAAVTSILKAALSHIIVEASLEQPGPWIALLSSVVQGSPEWRSRGDSGPSHAAEQRGSEGMQPDEDETPPSSPAAANTGTSTFEAQTVDQVCYSERYFAEASTLFAVHLSCQKYAHSFSECFDLITIYRCTVPSRKFLQCAAVNIVWEVSTLFTGHFDPVTTYYCIVCVRSFRTEPTDVSL